MIQLCVVVDIGKTNVKIQVIDRQLRCQFRRSRANRVLQQGPYPHCDTEALWRWICGTLKDIGKDHRVDAIAFTTHGATAALVDPEAGDSGLVLPVMDYEFEGVALDSDYDKIRPPFAETFSPALPAGLNLGRQLFWQQRHCKRAFNNTRYILPYPQYWVWRLTGIAVSEVTSWGCHTDLWAPAKRTYSSLAEKLNIEDKMPPLLSAGAVAGTITEQIAEQTGLPAGCKVYTGVHDSNASYSRYLCRDSAKPFTLISTGTWVVSFSSDAKLSCLDERRAMLANTDVNGNPVACVRFMGGRDFEAICLQTGSGRGGVFGIADLQEVIDQSSMALPGLDGSSGPCRPPLEILGQAKNGAALATVYCALMLDYQLDLLNSREELIIDGTWIKNPLLCGLITQLRPGQPVWLSIDESGPVSGVAGLIYDSGDAAGLLTAAAPVPVIGIDGYRAMWRRAMDTRLSQPS